MFEPIARHGGIVNQILGDGLMALFGTINGNGDHHAQAVLTAIDEGALLCTVDQQPAEQGYLGVQFAVRATNGEILPAEVLVDVRLIQGE